MRSSSSLLLAALVLVGCSASPVDGGDASSTHDAGLLSDAESFLDAAVGKDGGSALDAEANPEDAAAVTPDASPSGSDVGASTHDAGSGVDAGQTVPDAGAGCSVLGLPGDCMTTSACSAIADHASTAGYCAGPADVQCCTPCGLALCDPNNVQYPNATNTTEAPGQGGCPAGMILVTTFCVDQYEASLVRLDDGTSWSPYINPGSTAVRALSVQGAIPQAYIDGVQAGDACVNAGKRLCTDAEWLRACQGPSGDTYPYGNTRQPGVCNDHRDVHPAIEYFGTSASWIWSEIGNACIDQLPMSLDPAGARAGCVTAEGAYDMMGNLHEWTADPNGTFRGGYYVDTTLNGPGCLYVTTAHNTLHWDYSTGFRCCANKP